MRLRPDETVAGVPARKARRAPGLVTVASLMAVELKTRLVDEQRFQKRLALDELKAGDVPSVEMQKIESIIDERHIAFAVSGRLGVGEIRQPSVIDDEKKRREYLNQAKVIA
jgi:hypothetical protein